MDTQQTQFEATFARAVTERLTQMDALLGRIEARLTSDSQSLQQRLSHLEARVSAAEEKLATERQNNDDPAHESIQHRLDDGDLRRADLTRLVDTFAHASAGVHADQQQQISAQDKQISQAAEAAKSALSRANGLAGRMQKLGDSMEVWLNEITTLITDVARRVELQERRLHGGINGASHPVARDAPPAAPSRPQADNASSESKLPGGTR